MCGGWGGEDVGGEVLCLQSKGRSSRGFPGGSDGKSVCLPCGRLRFDPWVGKIPWRRKWQPTPVLLPGKFHGRRSMVGYSPWGCKESDTTEQVHVMATEKKPSGFYVERALEKIVGEGASSDPGVSGLPSPLDPACF